MVLLCVIYPLTIAFIGRFTAGGGGGQKLYKQDKPAGYALLGQSFSQPGYFWGRPSATDYNAAGSAGSNKGPSNPAYLQQISDRIDTLLKYHPGLRKADIPAEMVTASGSGLDPNISPQGAEIQLQRIARYRELDEKKLTALIQQHIKKPFLGCFGPATVNVLQLNLALDELKK